jgi:hypothetical protein
MTPIYKPKTAVASVGSNAILVHVSRYRVVTVINRVGVGQIEGCGVKGGVSKPRVQLLLCIFVR